MKRQLDLRDPAMALADLSDETLHKVVLHTASQDVAIVLADGMRPERTQAILEIALNVARTNVHGARAEVA